MVVDRPAPAALLAELRSLRAEMTREGAAQLAAWEPRLQRPSFAPSALNLAHYLALRRRDLRELQVALMPYGLSSLGRCESRVLPNVDAVVAALAHMTGDPSPPPYPSVDTFFAGEMLLRAAAEDVFGPTPARRTVRIMVTLPDEAATDPAFADDLLRAGTDVVRINCAHGDETVWHAMAANVRAAAARTGLPCSICVDIAGPKLRIDAVRTLKSSRDRVRVQRGDRFLLGDGVVVPTAAYPVAVRCSVPGVTQRVAIGASVWIDDGKVGTTCVALHEGNLVLEVSTAPAGGARLAPEKGLNFPETDLGMPALGDKDRADLRFVTAEADIVGYSFVTTSHDVVELYEELERCRVPGRPLPAVMLKVETVEAVGNLPGLIATAGGRGPVAVMIARGDLAVNIGYRRLAEIQEEILWLCESAHVPVVWATQVLEQLVKKGRASRGEFTDAAMAERAECVMLNKGPYVMEAIRALDDVLARMEGHQAKKTSRLRSLRAWAADS